jgi:tetratricopeptide (TPR) repeat protein
LSERNEAARLKRQGAEQAIALALESKWEEAVTLNRSIISLAPEDVDTWNRLGKALNELGRFQEAREAYGKALEIDPINNIARRNLDRLSALKEESDPRRAEAVTKVASDLFIEEIGKSGNSLLRGVPTELIAKMTAGDEVYLKPDGNMLNVENAQGESIGAVEPKLALRLTRLITGGNKYAAAVKSLGESEVQIIIKETYQDPSQLGRISFPSTTTGESVRPYIKDSILRYELDDEEEEVEEETETEDWETERESSEGTVSLSAYQAVERDDEEEEE